MSFFVLLLVCLGAGMAIGRGSADVMFLKRYGIEYLPVMYLVLSLVLAVCFTLYAAFVDRISSERFFYFLLSTEALMLMGFWLVIAYTDIQLVYPAYFIFYELVSELILVHATFYIAQSLDTLQSKRLTSLILAGYQLGMIIGGLFFAVMMPSIGVEHSMIIWSCLLMLSLAMLFFWHSKHGVSPFFIQPSKTNGRRVSAAIQEVTKGVQFVRSSPLLRNASFALFFMVLMFYVLTYSVNKIYSESFESEAALAMFFGLLVAGTNLLAVILQAFVSGRVIERIGVRKSKLIYPMLTVLSYVLLLVSPGFYMALIASVNNGSMMPAFRNPSRQMFFNVLPDYMKGRARATSVALVLPVALFVCGALILYLQTTPRPALIIYFGSFCALMYWFFCYRMGMVYSKTLIDNLKEKLYLPEEISKAAYKGNNDSLYPVLLKGLDSDDDKVCLSYAELMITAFPEESVLPILMRIESVQADVADRLISLVASEASELVLSDLMAIANKGDEHLKATIYDVVLNNAEKDYPELVETSLVEEHSRVRVPGIKAAIRKGHGELFQRGMEVWYELLDSDWPDQMTVIDMQPLMVHVTGSKRRELALIYSKMYVKLLEKEGENRRRVIYKAIARWQDLQSEPLYGLIKQDTHSVDPRLRCAAATCLHLLPEDQGRNEYIWAMLADGHASVRQSALQVMEALYDVPKEIYFEWLMSDSTGTPRAQKVLLEALINHGAEKASLKQIADKSSRYAGEILSALAVLEKEEGISITMTRTVLEERLTEMIDLVLMAIAPTMEKGLIAVIRAGLSSKDLTSVASAHEALQAIEDKQLAVLLSDMVGRKHDRATKQGYGKNILNVKDVLHWCVEYGDAWLRECSNKALMDMDKQVYA